jgi:hypothetical protein
MTQVETRPIPTVQASPALLQAGDRVYPDITDRSPEPVRVAGPAVAIADRDGNPGWQIPLTDRGTLWVADGDKVRTQRRPNPGPPTPPEVWDAMEDSYPPDGWTGIHGTSRRRSRA